MTTAIQTAKLSGYEMAEEIIAKEGVEFAISELNKAKTASHFWTGFADAIVEARGHHYRDGLLKRSY